MRDVERKERALPWRKEFDKDKLLGVDYRLEIGGIQVDDVRGRLCDGESGEGEREKRRNERRNAHPVAGQTEEEVDFAWLMTELIYHATSLNAK
jgi:hypothetical protein